MVDDQSFIAFYVQEGLACGFVGLVEFFEFEIVEPNSATASFADINGNIGDSDLLQPV
jgi:hypothetical protein